MSPRPRRALDEMTPAEAEVAALVADGLSDVEIALHRGCSPSAVKHLVASAARKCHGKGSSRIRLTRRVYAEMAPTRPDVSRGTCSQAQR